MAAAEEEAEILRKQLDLLRHQTEAAAETAPSADAAALAQDLASARKRIGELEEQLRPAAAPSAPASGGFGVEVMKPQSVVQHSP